MPPPHHFMHDAGPVKKFTLREQFALIRAFAAFYPKHKKLLILDLVFVLISPALSTGMPLIVYRALQDYLPRKDMKMLILCVVLILGLTLFQIVSNYIRMRFGDTLGMRIETDMRARLFSHIQNLSFSYFDKTKTGHIMSRITNDVGMIGGFAHHFPESIISTFIMLVGGLAVMLWINPFLTLLTLLPVPLMLVWSLKILPKMRSLFRKIRQDVANINSQVENSIQGVREVKSYTNESVELRRFRSVNHIYRKTNEQVYSTQAVFHSGMMFFLHGYNVLFIAFGVLLVFFDKATTAQLITFFMYSNQITMPILRLVDCVQMYQQGITAFERFHEVVSEQPEIQDSPDALSVLPAPMKGALRFDHVFFKYPGMKPEEPEVLNDISLDIAPGTTVALVGESGAGKTTLAALIPRFYEPRSGTVSIDGIPLAGYTQHLLRSNVGIVQQTPFLFDTTIRQNILFGQPEATEDQLIEAAKSANIYDFICTLPDGLDSCCGENGVRLSGGQKQRISLARIFLKNPPLLIFDEATSSLDNESEAQVQESMEKLCRGRTTIIIAHRLSTIKNANYILCMRGGRIVERGTHAELLALNGYYKELYTRHSF